MTEYVVAILSFINENDFRYVHTEARGRYNAMLNVLADPQYKGYTVVGIDEAERNKKGILV